MRQPKGNIRRMGRWSSQVVSTANVDESNSIQKWISTTRTKLQEQGILKQEGNVLKFTNYIFSSPSGAAGVVLGRNANGWIEWKYQGGKTLDEVKRQREQ